MSSDLNASVRNIEPGGLLKMGDPLEGALAVSTNREAAQELIDGGSFVLNGVVSRWPLVESDEALA